MPGDAAPIVKIGVIAPFEGLGRPFGYAVLPAIKAAIAEGNAAGKFGAYRVMLVALDDSLDPRAAVSQADALAEDPDLVAVLGPFETATARSAAPILAQAGIPVLVAAPLADPPHGIYSLCPPFDRLAAAESAAARAANVLNPYTEDAAAAADELSHRYAMGDQRALVGGPDLFRPWLIARAGVTAEGTMAAVCWPDGFSLPEDAGEAADASLAYAAAFADYGTQLILRGVSTDVAAHGEPTRAGVAAALAAQPITTGLTWYAVQNGKWAPMSEP